MTQISVEVKNTPENNHLVRRRGKFPLRKKNERSCSLDGCSRRLYARGLCGMHYGRLRAHGDPLAGGTSLGALKTFLRETVMPFEGDECLIWPYAKDEKGYAAQIKWKGQRQRVCRVVCEARHGPPPTPSHQAAHFCGSGHNGCVNPKHLRWATPKENQADRLIHGTDSRGEKHYAAKLSARDIRQIRALKGRKTQHEIAKQFGVTQQQISYIQRGLRWRCL